MFPLKADNLVPEDSNGSSDVYAIHLFDLCGGRVPTVFGTNGDGALFGSDRPDVIGGRGGNDIIDDLGGIELLRGGKGSDIVIGGRGDSGRCDRGGEMKRRPPAR